MQRPPSKGSKRRVPFGAVVTLGWVKDKGSATGARDHAEARYDGENRRRDFCSIQDERLHSR